MATIYEVRDEVRKVDVNPLSVVLGATDLYVEWLRKEMPEPMRYKGSMETVATVMSIPRRTIEWGFDKAVDTVAGYEALGQRGKKLAKRIRQQQATKQLVEQAQYTVSAGKGAVTPYVKAAEPSEETSESALAAAVSEGRRAVKAIYRTMADQAANDRERWNEAAENSKSRMKATVTSARNTVEAGRLAAAKAVEKVGA